MRVSARGPSARWSGVFGGPPNRQTVRLLADALALSGDERVEFEEAVRFSVVTSCRATETPSVRSEQTPSSVAMQREYLSRSKMLSVSRSGSRKRPSQRFARQTQDVTSPRSVSLHQDGSPDGWAWSARTLEKRGYGDLRVSVREPAGNV